jgi:hypothetical protein
MDNTCKCGAKVPSYQGHICGACCKAAVKVLGHVTVPEQSFLNRGHESAAQYYTVRVEPGTYPVELRITSKGEQYLATAFTGICTASGYGSKRYESEIGQPGEVVYRPYRYELQAGKAHGFAVTLTDAEALEAARGPYLH